MFGVWFPSIKSTWQKMNHLSEFSGSGQVLVRGQGREGRSRCCVNTMPSTFRTFSPRQLELHPGNSNPHPSACLPVPTPTGVTPRPMPRPHEDDHMCPRRLQGPQSSLVLCPSHHGGLGGGSGDRGSPIAGGLARERSLSVNRAFRGDSSSLPGLVLGDRMAQTGGPLCRG